ncbi:MAG: hypothetical protein M0T84_02495 [Betaproteobacteria bacterium]|nr:hypothetical protein [Betaproteobacteria bacterium]
MSAADLNKVREICFSAVPKDQAARAAQALEGLAALSVHRSPDRPCCLVVAYDLRDYTLAGLEEALAGLGFHLDNALLHKLKRALVYYCEGIQRESLDLPGRDEQTRQIFVQVYDHHPHGDHDDTPLEWREYH